MFYFRVFISVLLWHLILLKIFLKMEDLYKCHFYLRAVLFWSKFISNKYIASSTSIDGTFINFYWFSFYWTINCPSTEGCVLIFLTWLINLAWNREILSGFILESKGIGAVFQKMAKNCWKSKKYLKIWDKMYKIWKYFEKEQVIACDNCTQ